MAIEHIRTVVMSVEESNGIMAKHDVLVALGGNLLIVGDFVEASAYLSVNSVVVALDKNLATFERVENSSRDFVVVPANIAEYINRIFVRNFCIPVADECLVHFFYGSKRSVVEA